MPMDTIPAPRDDDDEDVHWALSTATALWARGERAEALRWLRRAAETASDAEADERALELFKAAADATGIVASQPPPASSAADERATAVPETIVAPPPSVRPAPSRAAPPPPAPSRPPPSIRPSPAAASARPAPPSVRPPVAAPSPRPSARPAPGTTPPPSAAAERRPASAWPVPSQRATQPSELAPASRVPDAPRSTRAAVAPTPPRSKPSAAPPQPAARSAPRPGPYDDLDEETRVLEGRDATPATSTARTAPRAEPAGASSLEQSTVSALQVAVLSGGAGQVEIVPLASLDGSVRAPRAVLVPLGDDDARAIAAMFAPNRS